MGFEDALGQLFLLSDDFSSQISDNFMTSFGGGGGGGGGGGFGGDPTTAGSQTIFDPNFQPETFFGGLGGGGGGVQRDIGVTGELGGGQGVVRFGGGFQTEAASRRNALRTILKELGLPDPRTDPNAFTLKSGKRARFNAKSGLFEASRKIEIRPGGAPGEAPVITNIRGAAPAALTQDEQTELQQQRAQRTRAASALSPGLLQVLQKTAQRGARSTEELTQNLRGAVQQAQTLGPERFLTLQTAASALSRQPGQFAGNLAKLFLGEEQRQRTEEVRLGERAEAFGLRAEEREEAFREKREIAEIRAGRAAEQREAKAQTADLKRRARAKAREFRAAARVQFKDNPEQFSEARNQINDAEKDALDRIASGDLDAEFLKGLGISPAAFGGGEPSGAKAPVTQRPPTEIGGIQLGGARRVTAPKVLERAEAATAGSARQLLNRTITDTKGFDFDQIAKAIKRDAFTFGLRRTALGAPGKFREASTEEVSRILFVAQEFAETGNDPNDIALDKGGSRLEGGRARRLVQQANTFAERLASKVAPEDRKRATKILIDAIIDRLIQQFQARPAFEQRR